MLAETAAAALPVGSYSLQPNANVHSWIGTDAVTSTTCPAASASHLSDRDASPPPPLGKALPLLLGTPAVPARDSTTPRVQPSAERSTSMPQRPEADGEYLPRPARKPAGVMRKNAATVNK